MPAIVDTSPLSYLVLLGHANLLPQTFHRVWIPPAVREELQHPKAPERVRRWIADPPAWLEVRSPKGKDVTPPSLGAGESQAIALAAEFKDVVLIIDDRAGREEAQRRGIGIAGTLAVLFQAGSQGRLDFEKVLGALQASGFRVSPRLREVLVEKYLNERRRLIE